MQNHNTKISTNMSAYQRPIQNYIQTNAHPTTPERVVSTYMPTFLATYIYYTCISCSVQIT